MTFPSEVGQERAARVNGSIEVGFDSLRPFDPVDFIKQANGSIDARIINKNRKIWKNLQASVNQDVHVGSNRDVSLLKLNSLVFRNARSQTGHDGLQCLVAPRTQHYGGSGFHK